MSDQVLKIVFRTKTKSRERAASMKVIEKLILQIVIDSVDDTSSTEWELKLN